MKKGNIWFSSKTGLSKFNVNSNILRTYTREDGLQSNEFWRNAYLKLRDGQMLFGGINGFNIFHPDSIVDNNIVPEIEITNLKIFNKEIKVTPNSILKKQISECDTIYLNHSQSVFTLEFTALSFTDAEQNSYAYKLNPFDQDFNYVGKKHFATYTNLDPGKYVFKVIGSNNDGVWNEVGKELTIIIQPPFHKTWWFKCILIMALILLIIGAWMYRTRTIRVENINLERRIKERTSLLEDANEELKINHEKIILQSNELKQYQLHLEDLIVERTKELNLAKEKAEESDKLKSAFLANVSHEIRTPMNAIIGFSTLIVDPHFEDELKAQYSEYIIQNCKSLNVLIDDILDISIMDSGKLNCNMEEFDITQILQELFTYYSHIKSGAISLVKDFNNHPMIIKSAPIRVKQVINNLLSNAFKFTDSGEIKLGCFAQDKNIYCYVQDSGKGISEENLHKVFDRFYKLEDNPQKLTRGTGLGLAISKALCQKLNGDLSVESTLCVGSKFTMSLNNCVV